VNHYVLVTGGRDYYDQETVFEVLGFLEKFYGPALRILHGGASGADTLAQRFCDTFDVTHRAFPADWNGPCRPGCDPNHRRKKGRGSYCPAAGVYRNLVMLDYLDFCRNKGHTVQVVAFPGGSGTLHCYGEAALRGLEPDKIDW
jgi:hypothetical protein